MKRNSVLWEQIQMYTWKCILYEDINLNTLHLGLNSLFEWRCCIFHFLSLKVARNRKIPEDLTETHESDLHLREQ